MALREDGLAELTPVPPADSRPSQTGPAVRPDGPGAGPRPPLEPESSGKRAPILPDPHLVRLYRQYSVGAAIAVIALGGLALFGRVTGIPILGSFSPSWTVMKVNGAIGLILAGLATFLFITEHDGRSRHSLAAQLCAGAAALIGLLTLVEMIFGVDLGIDQLLIPEGAGAVGTPVPGRISLIAAFCLFLAGSALLIRGARRDGPIPSSLGLVIISAASVALSGYLLGAHDLDNLGGQFTTISAPMALALFLLGSAITIGDPQCRLVRILASPRAGGVLLRHLLPVAVLLPLALNWLELGANRLGLFSSTELGSAIAFVIDVVVLIVIIIWAAARLDRTDAARLRGEALSLAARYSRSLLEASLDPLVAISADGRITDVNEATVRATGLSRDELIGSEFENYFTDPEKAHAGYREVFEKGSVVDYPLTLRHRSGALTDVLYNASVYRDKTGAVAGIFAAARDVTARKRAEEHRARANRALQMLNVCNSILIHAEDKSKFVDEVCRTIVKVGGYKLAWVGSAENDVGLGATSKADPEFRGVGW